MPASRDDLGPFYRDVIAVSPLEPWDAASAAYRLEILARTLPFPVDSARLVPSNNNDVWRLETGYLRVAWRGDRSRLAREAELLERLRGLVPVPEVLDRGGDDRLSWSLTTGMPGPAFEHLCVQPAPPRLRDLAREVAALLRALHFLRQHHRAVDAAHDPAGYQHLRRLLHVWSLTAIAAQQPGYYEELAAARTVTAMTVPVTDAIPNWPV